MPPKNKATTRSTKKGKSVSKKSAPVMEADHESDWTSGDDEPSMREMVRGLTSMMSSLNARMNQMDGGGRKKRKVTFRGANQEAETSTPATTSAMVPAQPMTSQQPLLTHWAEPADTCEATQLPPPSAPAPMSLRETESVSTAPPLPDVSEAVRACVAQCLQGAPESFLLTDEDSPSDEDTSPRKRKRTMKSGKLRIQDTHVVLRKRSPHEVV